MADFEKGTIQKWMYDRELKNTLLDVDNVVEKVRRLSTNQLIELYYDYYDGQIEKAQKRLEALQARRDKF